MIGEDDNDPFDLAVASVAADLLEQGDGDAILNRYGCYESDPIGFFRDVLGSEPWESDDPEIPGQADVLRALGLYDRVVVKSGHKTSKSFSASGLALWWVCTRKGARAVITAPTFNQIKGIIWRELRARFRDRGLEDKLGAALPLDPSTGLQLPNGNEILGLSTKTAENLAGISAPHLMFIIDEASGFPDELFQVIMGNSAGGSKIFAITNPTRTRGWFFEIFRKRTKGWHRFTLNSENTPNVRARKRLIPGLATWEWVEEMREACGPDYENDPTYMVRVRGEFPPQGSDAVIGVRAVEVAQDRWKKRNGRISHTEGELVLGVDCARYGNDDNVIQPVRGLYAWEPIAVDTGPARNSIELTAGQMVADEVVRVAMQLRHGLEKVRVNVDGIGVGAAVVDALKQCKPVRDGWLYMCDLNVGEKADETEGANGEVKSDYPNLRSQLWFGCAQWLKEGGAIPEHERLGGELLAATYVIDDRGRKKVESKEKMRAALDGRSPDYADALCMATYRGTRGAIVDVGYTPATDSRHGGDAGGRGGSFGFL